MNSQDLRVAIDEHEVARLTGRAAQTLRNERHKGIGIPYIKIGRSVRYMLSDVLEYLENHRIVPRN